MPISLYDATVPSFIQIVGATKKILEKASDWISATKQDEADIVHARFAEDMFDFAYQVKSVGSHSIGAIEGVRAGAFAPDMSKPPQSMAGLIERMAEVETALAAIDPDEIESLIGRPVEFSLPSKNLKLPFVAENFLLSFSQTNFYFHATTAYDILRWKGMDVGKVDYMGHMRFDREQFRQANG